ncbi:AraC family transcriptional regulator [Mucilaginibacter sp. AK015]|uniref:helix-turn-helix domain-containing protein n=1 Tax=Mucilaginibacter sp. AK015 TaxID=2723072 RepID=UPI0016163035|nr:AraC family transcriptional regulator [Mucilaginibacter sp. AK015]MBB5395170.1 AraC-like DNA-binding protein [Mucilaginibacter sp. AK015]
MEIVRVPEATRQQPQITTGEIAFVDYSDRGGPFRNRVLFDRYAISLVQQGQKQIYRAGGNTILRPGHGMLIPQGHSIIAEHSNTNELYHSFIVFFPEKIGHDFIAHQPDRRLKSTAPYLHFEVSDYINDYVQHLRTLIRKQQTLSASMAELKVQELLTALYEKQPDVIAGIFGGPGNNSLKALVEQHLLTPLTLDELAFLANRSLSSFKRDFEKAYQLSPQRYIRQRRLEIAASELVKGRPASELYLDYGYQHLSNFNTAFKRQFGHSPTDWASRNKG